jgi:hypothetical protein
MWLALPALAVVVSMGVASSAEAPQAAAPDESPEAKMSRRFPQKIRTGDLLGLPVMDDGDVTLGHVRKVIRTPEGKIKLIVSYSRWFGFGGRLVAVPIEVVAILARQLASLDMAPVDYEAAPTWVEADNLNIPPDEIIRIAITRR